jgi:hypothetical protein
VLEEMKALSVDYLEKESRLNEALQQLTDAQLNFDMLSENWNSEKLKYSRFLSSC